jgi:hypothetical protein
MAPNVGLENSECGNHRVQRGSSIRIGASNPGVQDCSGWTKKVTSGNTVVRRTERVAAEDWHLKDNPTEWKESQPRRTSGQVGGK